MLGKVKTEMGPNRLKSPTPEQRVGMVLCASLAFRIANSVIQNICELLSAMSPVSLRLTLKQTFV